MKKIGAINISYDKSRYANSCFAVYVASSRIIQEQKDPPDRDQL